MSETIKDCRFEGMNCAIRVRQSTDTIALTRKEVREAREQLDCLPGCVNFLHYLPDEHNGCKNADPPVLSKLQDFADCQLCKKLTQFAGGGDE